MSTSAALAQSTYSAFPRSGRHSSAAPHGGAKTRRPGQFLEDPDPSILATAKEVDSGRSRLLRTRPRNCPSACLAFMTWRKATAPMEPVKTFDNLYFLGQNAVRR